MTTWLATFLIMFLAFLGLAAGVLLGRAPIKGSCGGLGGGCSACAGPCRRRERQEG